MTGPSVRVQVVDSTQTPGMLSLRLAPWDPQHRSSALLRALVDAGFQAGDIAVLTLVKRGGGEDRGLTVEVDGVAHPASDFVEEP